MQLLRYLLGNIVFVINLKIHPTPILNCKCEQDMKSTKIMNLKLILFAEKEITHRKKERVTKIKNKKSETESYFRRSLRGSQRAFASICHILCSSLRIFMNVCFSDEKFRQQQFLLERQQLEQQQELHVARQR